MQLTLLPRVPYVFLNQDRLSSYPKSPNTNTLVGFIAFILLYVAVPAVVESTSPTTAIFISPSTGAGGGLTIGLGSHLFVVALYIWSVVQVGLGGSGGVTTIPSTVTRYPV